jgi:hypothetical protein
MKRFLLVITLFAACAVPAYSATACFDWSCNTTGLCTIDAGCSSASPFIWKYDFAFGDGTSTGLTGVSVQSHQYGSSIYEAYVTLRIMYWSDPGVNTITCSINTRMPVVGPLPQPGSSYFYGRCTQ